MATQNFKCLNITYVVKEIRIHFLTHIILFNSASCLIVVYFLYKRKTRKWSFIFFFAMKALLLCYLCSCDTHAAIILKKMTCFKACQNVILGQFSENRNQSVNDTEAHP